MMKRTAPWAWVLFPLLLLTCLASPNSRNPDPKRIPPGQQTLVELQPDSRCSSPTFTKALERAYTNGTLRLYPLGDRYFEDRANRDGLLICLIGPGGDDIRQEIKDIRVKGWWGVNQTLLAELVTKIKALKTLRYDFPCSNTDSI